MSSRKKYTIDGATYYVARCDDDPNKWALWQVCGGYNGTTPVRQGFCYCANENEAVRRMLGVEP